MAMFLKQSTAVTIKFGPLIDDTDGKTAEVALTLSQADFRLAKNGGDMAQKNESTSATHDEVGYYDVMLDATDTNTLGGLRVMVHESGALPVWADFMVVPAQVWDSLFGADKLQVHVDEMTAGIITAAVIANDAITAAKIADGAIDAATFAANAINDAAVASDVTIASVTGAVGSVTGNVGGNVVGSVASVTAGVTVTTNNDKTGYGLSAAAIQAIWDALTSALTTVGSIGKLLVDNINAAIGSRSSHSAADVWAAGTRTLTANTNLSIPSAADNADAVWDEATTGHTTSGTFGEQAKSDVDAILAKTNLIPAAPAKTTA